jgi:hypothetical protein
MMYRVKKQGLYWKQSATAAWTPDVKEARVYGKKASAESGKMSIIRNHKDIDPTSLTIEEVEEASRGKS